MSYKFELQLLRAEFLMHMTTINCGMNSQPAERTNERTDWEVTI